MTKRSASLLLALLPTLAHADSLPTDRYITHQRPLDDLVSVPAGTFVMGATALNQSIALEMCRQQIGKKLERNCTVDKVAAETPADRTFISAFHLDRVEVTIAAYRRCIAAGICDPQPIVQSDPRFVEDRLPVTNVTHAEAERFCRWRGARLPTEAEWERAARGGDGRLFPWGNQPLKQAANLGKFTNVDGPVAPASTPIVQADASDGFAFVAPVGSFPNGQSPFGVLDLAGNVAEWTADYFDAEAPQRRSRYNPHGPATGEQRTVRGGSWRTPLFMARATTRTGTDPTERSSEIGFRCAMNGE